MYPLGTWFVSGVGVWTLCIKETIMIIIIIKIMENIAADCFNFQNQDSWTFFPVCTTVAVFVLASRPAHKNQQHDVVSFIICAKCTVCSLLSLSPPNTEHTLLHVVAIF